MSLLFNAEEGYYSLTTAGMIIFIILTVILLLDAAVIRAHVGDVTNKGKSEPGKRTFSTRQMVFAGVSLALAFALSFIKILHLPWGGSVTLCSMLFVTIIGYWYGPKIGLVSALAYGILQFVQGGGGYILSPMQVALDYIVAFMALGVSGFFNRKKNGLITGYAVAIFLRAVFHSIGGYIYWMDYMPEDFPQSLAAIYPIVYNFAYIVLEGILTVLILMIPGVKNGIGYITRLATQDSNS